IIFNGDDSAKLTVKGGTFKNYNGEVINLYQGTVKITGGTLKAYGKSSSAVYADTGTLKITGGTIYSKKYYAVYYRERDCTYSEKNAKVSTGSDEYISVYASED
ncbi:MAG: hypothetical protein LUE63_08855, partial [Lachnospiraceae bacterium]|nr:hypothetical protein [Lachnospiraceae bacterium]